MQKALEFAAAMLRRAKTFLWTTAVRGRFGRFGRGSAIEPFSALANPACIEIGARAHIREHAWLNCFPREDGKPTLVIKDGTYVGRFFHANAFNRIVIEENVMIADRVVLMRADSQEGEPVALRACVLQGDKAWDLLAAASDSGRKNYASYAIFWALVSQCRALGVRTYDMGGADPDKARGVYDFKKGARARPVEYLGEWDWSNLPLVRRGFGLGLKALGVGDA